MNAALVWLNVVLACAGVAAAVFAYVQAKTATDAKKDADTARDAAQEAQKDAQAARDEANRIAGESRDALGRSAAALERQAALAEAESGRQLRHAFGEKVVAYSRALRDNQPVADSDRPAMLGTAPDQHGVALLEWAYQTFGQAEADYRHSPPYVTARVRELIHDRLALEIAVWVAKGESDELPTMRDLWLPTPHDGNVDHVTLEGDQ